MTGWPWRGFAQNLGYDVEENPPVEKQHNHSAYQTYYQGDFQGGIQGEFRPGPSTPSFAKASLPVWISSRWIRLFCLKFSVPMGNLPQGGSFNCFKCREPGHKSLDFQKTLFREGSIRQDCEDHTTIFDQPIIKKIGGDLVEKEGLALMMRKNLCAKAKK